MQCIKQPQGDGILLLHMNMIPPLETDLTPFFFQEKEEQEHRLFCNNLPLCWLWGTHKVPNGYMAACGLPVFLHL